MKKYFEALVNKEPKHLEIVLWYEQSTESDIDVLLLDNMENVHAAQPIYI